jgi:DNA transformation protein
MKPPDPLAERIVGLLTPLGPVRARRMFGGHGLFLDDLMFALISGGALYFKADGETEDAFRAAGSRPFTYRRQGKDVALSYWRAPEGALDGMAALAPWAEQAIAAARRTRAQ